MVQLTPHPKSLQEMVEGMAASGQAWHDALSAEAKRTFGTKVADLSREQEEKIYNDPELNLKYRPFKESRERLQKRLGVSDVYYNFNGTIDVVNSANKEMPIILRVPQENIAQAILNNKDHPVFEGSHISYDPELMALENAGAPAVTGRARNWTDRQTPSQEPQRQ